MCYIQDPVIYLFVVLANVFYVLVQTVLNLSSWDPVSFCCTSNFLVQQTSSYNKNCRISIFEWSWNPRKIDVNIWMCYNWICTKTEYIWCLISLTSMSMHKLRNIAILVDQLLGFHQFSPEKLNNSKHVMCWITHRWIKVKD